MGRYRIAVIGGSLGGLTAGCLLRDDGHDVTVFERSPHPLEERGAGIGFLEPTYRYLVDRVGTDLARISVATGHIRYLDRDGSVRCELDHPYLFSSWNTIYRELLAHFGTERYRLGHELVEFDSSDHGVQAHFANGHLEEVDLLVAADGIGSVTRAALQPTATPVYAGYVGWRGMVPETEVAEQTATALGDAITYHVQPDSHILLYPIPDAAGSVEPGTRLLNFVWYRNYAEGRDLDDLLTDRWGRPRSMSVPPGAVTGRHRAELRAVAEDTLPPQLAEVVVGAKEPFVQTIYDISVDAMAFGRVCLVGDAAFAVRPHAAAGTAKAAEDGWALAEALASTDSVDAALATWEPTQLALGRSLLDRTRRIGTRSQVTNEWDPNDPELIFGLHEPGR